MKKLTAVEWLHYKIMYPISHEPVDNINLWFLKAKEMEKEQIKQAYLDSSQETCRSYGEEAPHDDPKFAELYYKQTYEKK
jgi:hypothetical protein